MIADNYGHTSIKKMFDLADVYGVGLDEERLSRKKIRIAIVGCGGVAQSKHIPAINRLKTIWEPIELVAISVRTKAQGEKISNIYSCKWYSDYKEMIKNEEIDGVIISSPDALHYEHAMTCLESNLNILLEKPFTLSLAEGIELCKHADDKGLVLMTVSNKRYSPPYWRAKKIVEDGPVNNPALFCGKFNLGYKYVNLLEDGTIHVLDLTRYFIGDVSAVNAVGINKYRKSKYPADNIIITFAFKSGSIGAVYTSSTALSLKPWERIEIYGDGAWLAVEDQYELMLFDSEEGPAKSWKPVIPNTLIFDEEFGGFMGLIENFAQSIRGLEKPVVTGWDGYKACELAVAAHLSLKLNETVRLPVDPNIVDNEIKNWLS